MAESNTGGSRNATKEEVLALMDLRKSKEEELLAWHGVLESQGVGMDEPLVDEEDYPSEFFFMNFTTPII